MLALDKNIENGKLTLEIRLEVSDPDVVFELRKHREGPAREDYASSALTLVSWRCVRPQGSWILRRFVPPPNIC